MSESAYQAKQPLDRFAAGGTANRSAATVDGLAMALAPISLGMLGPGEVVGRGATLLVAASNATGRMVANADYACDGTADEVEINAALTALSAVGGTVLLSEGAFTLAGPITLGTARLALRGMGMGATVLTVVAAGGAPVNAGIVRLNADYCEVSDLTVSGNKANNASATSMALVAANTAVAPTARRLRLVNSAQYGLVFYTTARNGVVRDCLVDGAAAYGMILRSVAGQPLVASGCTAKGGAGTAAGFHCDDGPVVLADCQALGNGGVGFYVSATDTALDRCTAQANGSYGFQVTGATARLTGCRAVANVNAGFVTTGARTAFVGCMATGTTGGGVGFQVGGGVSDALLVGCAVADSAGTGYYHDATGRASYLGCRAVNQAWGFDIPVGSAHIRNCLVVGVGAASTYGIAVRGTSTQNVVDGNRVTTLQGNGIHVEVTHTQVTNNVVTDCGLGTTNNYNHIALYGGNAFVAGNLCREAASGNRSYSAIGIAGAVPTTFLGLNDLRGCGITGEFTDGGTNTRRIVSLALDYVSATNLATNLAVPANTWTTIVPDQTFRVNMPNSLVEIAVRGMVMVGNCATLGAIYSSRILVDGATVRMLGAQGNQGTTSYQNPLSGSQPVKLRGLAVGNHTVRLQVLAGAAAVAYCRSATYPQLETLGIQVTEFARS